ncbi:MAG: cobalt-precorrin-5B (C(1))-methyltransferase [Mariprofundales bacterium]|nr:cobalt-precorrin-5B (C(1))-methyltransferase [Mariprofundales bacterium]
MKQKTRGTRKGFTTGANAAAAARAAVVGLMTGNVPPAIESLLPNGSRVRFAIHNGAHDGDHAHAVCIKDAGDDPDCTNGAHLTADVCLLSGQAGAIVITGGSGVGTITMRGLGLEVGGAAINPVPRQNIEANVREVGHVLLDTHGLEITISVPGGEEMAKKTLNHRLGIMGGISILGTTGIVHPYSTAAFRASVVQGIEVAANQGQETVVLTTGGRTEKFVIAALPDLAPACFVQMGDFLGPALDSCAKEGIKQIIIGGMVGKLTKMAQGEIITHANRQAVNTTLLAEIAKQCGAPESHCAEIKQAETARFAAETMEDLGLATPFYHALARRTINTLSGRYANTFSIRVLVCDFAGNPLADVEGEAVW